MEPDFSVFNNADVILKIGKATHYIQIFLQRYVQNTKLIYKKEFERFFEGVNGELSKIADFERRTTLRGSETMKSIAEKSLHAESKVDSKEVIRVSVVSIRMKSKVWEWRYLTKSAFFDIYQFNCIKLNMKFNK